MLRDAACDPARTLGRFLELTRGPTGAAELSWALTEPIPAADLNDALPWARWRALPVPPSQLPWAQVEEDLDLAHVPLRWLAEGAVIGALEQTTAPPRDPAGVSLRRAAAGAVLPVVALSRAVRAAWNDPPQLSRASQRRQARVRLLRLVAILVVASVVSPLLVQALPGRAFAVATGSMEPAIPVGALVLTRPGEPVIGDVVVYWSPTGEYNVHRIVDETVVRGDPYYVTRGDANDAVDSYLVPPKMCRALWHTSFRAQAILG